MNDAYTFRFKIDPELNEGYEYAFNQSEPWFWVEASDGGYAAGDVDLKGAKLIGVFIGPTQIWWPDDGSEVWE